MPERYPPFTDLERLESHLGDPHDERVVFSHAACVRLDAAEEFPGDICAHLDRWGVPAYYVPAECGGALRTLEHGLHLLRAIARRDLTVAIGHGKTFLGAVSAWFGGPEIQELVARWVLAGVPVSWGLTERAHGSDLLAGEVTVEETDGALRLTGEKWLINNATRGGVTAVLARVHGREGPRAFDVVYADKAGLAPGTFRTLPKERTLGIRGADISGIAYTGAPVPEGNRVGEPGTGLETVLRALQLTRTMCAGLSLGGGEHALRLAMSMLGPRAGEPEARARLLDAYADHLAAEVVATVAARCAHLAPAELSVVSAAVKYLVPLRTDALIRRLGDLLGMAAWDGGPEAVRFDKVARDHRIVDLFDGNRVVNLYAIVNQLPLLAAACARPVEWPQAAGLAALDRPCPALAPGRLRLVAARGVTVLRALPGAAERLREMAARRPELRPLAEVAAEVLARARSLCERTAALKPAPALVPVEHFEAAESFAAVFAAAAAVEVWLATHGSKPVAADDPRWAGGAWVRMVVHRLLGTPCDEPAREAMWTALTAQHREGMLLSLFPCRLAEGGMG
ncbi:alkylation response protein AidB-like acyl-CoA dehydrogenase [Thermocatellispora tengchongensis]|uniref:Alkylation response protein AidB-like acyl-CoA dehydrogenase n=1 Tax=Thermocatellispora tengchongensis TaxID=1073253 RepID=A0A840NXQ3_9ACTN|nr:acyl-CoA dehydrogenase family protein [Thermocatellispora tengchongensis]MBB5132288.1 alkylation response protein AidB-like acyl-CoA dehydrogenase [Thermocatellispora tengchongensis]